MNYRFSSPSTAKGRRVWLFLTLLMPAAASKMDNQYSACYLQAVGSPALRFQEAPPPPQPMQVLLRLAAAEAQVAEPNPPPAPAEPAAVKPAAPAPVPVSAPPKPVEGPDIVRPPSPPTAAAEMAAPILPDDTQTRVRPEDFLPFFQYPGSAPRDNGVPVPPAPPPQPQSTATYTQQ
jgi:hypothetical protein